MTPIGVLYELLELARRALDDLSRPGAFFLIVTQVKGEDGMMEFKVTAPLPALTPGKGTTVREITVTLNGTVQTPVNVPPTTPQYEQWFDEGAKVKMSLVDIDQAGNRSLARETNEIEVIDTVPPPQPGQFQLGVSDEREKVEPPTPPA